MPTSGPEGRCVGAGVVGTGTPESCTEAVLDAPLAGGGAVKFDCGASPFTFTRTTTKTIAVDTSLDGAGHISLSGSGTGAGVGGE